MSFKRGFTLAEVLITLSIIGVVAALTIPGLIVNNQKKEYSLKIKKFYSSMIQAYALAKIDYGSLVDEEVVQGGGDIVYWNYVNKYFAPYLNFIKAEKVSWDENGNATLSKFTFADGSTFDIWHGACIDFNYDANGAKAPNKGGLDRQSFTICKGSTFGPTQWPIEKNASRETVLNYCKNNSGYCALLLQYDDWEFKEDYPY